MLPLSLKPTSQRRDYSEAGVDHRRKMKWAWETSTLQLHPGGVFPHVTLGQQQTVERGPLPPPPPPWQPPQDLLRQLLSPAARAEGRLLAHPCWGSGIPGAACGGEGPRRRRAAPWAPSGAGLGGAGGGAWLGVAWLALRDSLLLSGQSFLPAVSGQVALRRLASALRALLLGISPRGPAWMERPGRGGGGGGTSPGPGEGSAALTPGPAHPQQLP